MGGAKVIVFVLTTVLTFASGFANNITCGDNEVVDECPRSCATDYCSTSEDDYNKVCPTPETCPPAKCVCGFNYRRAANNTCIPARSCPPFECKKQNEEYNACPGLCPTDSCEDAPRHGVCPFRILIVIECRGKCRCGHGFCRQNGTCIPYKETETAQQPALQNIFNIFLRR